MFGEIWQKIIQSLRQTLRHGDTSDSPYGGYYQLWIDDWGSDLETVKSWPEDGHFLDLSEMETLPETPWMAVEFEAASDTFSFIAITINDLESRGVTTRFVKTETPSLTDIWNINRGLES